MSHRATFFLSTGRCGTQWLTETLRAVLGDRAVVEHEPLHNYYAPRQMLGAKDPSLVGGRCARRIQEHTERIERTLQTQEYVETGHPCWSSIPWLRRRFEGRIRIVHLVRHPVPTACSWVSHGAYVPPLLPHLPTKELILSTDPGVQFPEFAASWDRLSAYEKCLVYWAEVNALGLSLESDAGIPWLRVQYEGIFDPAQPDLPRLFEFMGVPASALATVERGERIDEHRFQLDRWPEPERIAQHPRVVAIASALGYDANRWNAGALTERFLGGPT